MEKENEERINNQGSSAFGDTCTHTRFEFRPPIVVQLPDSIENDKASNIENNHSSPLMTATVEEVISASEEQNPEYISTTFEEEILSSNLQKYDENSNSQMSDLSVSSITHSELAAAESLGTISELESDDNAVYGTDAFSSLLPLAEQSTANRDSINNPRIRSVGHPVICTNEERSSHEKSGAGIMENSSESENCESQKNAIAENLWYVDGLETNELSQCLSNSSYENEHVNCVPGRISESFKLNIPQNDSDTHNNTHTNMTNDEPPIALLSINDLEALFNSSEISAESSVASSMLEDTEVRIREPSQPIEHSISSLCVDATTKYAPTEGLIVSKPQIQDNNGDNYSTVHEMTSGSESRMSPHNPHKSREISKPPMSDSSSQPLSTDTDIHSHSLESRNRSDPIESRKHNEADNSTTAICRSTPAMGMDSTNVNVKSKQLNSHFESGHDNISSKRENPKPSASHGNYQMNDCDTSCSLSEFRGDGVSPYTVRKGNDGYYLLDSANAVHDFEEFRTDVRKGQLLLSTNRGVAPYFVIKVNDDYFLRDSDCLIFSLYEVCVGDLPSTSISTIGERNENTLLDNTVARMKISPRVCSMDGISTSIPDLLSQAVIQEDSLKRKSEKDSRSGQILGDTGFAEHLRTSALTKSITTPVYSNSCSADNSIRPQKSTVDKRSVDHEKELKKKCATIESTAAELVAQSVSESMTFSGDCLQGFSESFEKRLTTGKYSTMAGDCSETSSRSRRNLNSQKRCVSVQAVSQTQTECGMDASLRISFVAGDKLESSQPDPHVLKRIEKMPDSINRFQPYECGNNRSVVDGKLEDGSVEATACMKVDETVSKRRKSSERCKILNLAILADETDIDHVSALRKVRKQRRSTTKKHAMHEIDPPHAEISTPSISPGGNSHEPPLRPLKCPYDDLKLRECRVKLTKLDADIVGRFQNTHAFDEMRESVDSSGFGESVEERRKDKELHQLTEIGESGGAKRQKPITCCLDGRFTGSTHSDEQMELDGTDPEEAAASDVLRSHSNKRGSSGKRLRKKLKRPLPLGSQFNAIVARSESNSNAQSSRRMFLPHGTETTESRLSSISDESYSPSFDSESTETETNLEIESSASLDSERGLTTVPARETTTCNLLAKLSKKRMGRARSSDANRLKKSIRKKRRCQAEGYNEISEGNAENLPNCSPVPYAKNFTIVDSNYTTTTESANRGRIKPIIIRTSSESKLNRSLDKSNSLNRDLSDSFTEPSNDAAISRDSNADKSDPSNRKMVESPSLSPNSDAPSDSDLDDGRTSRNVETYMSIIKALHHLRHFRCVKCYAEKPMSDIWVSLKSFLILCQDCVRINKQNGSQVECVDLE